MIRQVMRDLSAMFPVLRARYRHRARMPMGQHVTHRMTINSMLRRAFVVCSIAAVLISCSAIFTPSNVAAASGNVGGQQSKSAVSTPCPVQMFSQSLAPQCDRTKANTVVNAASTLAPGFQESVAITGLTNPTSLHFASDGRVFVTQKNGLILVYNSLTSTTPTIFADLRSEVDDYWDRGLLGLALDPNFPATPYVYVIYAFDAPIGGTAPTWNDTCPTPPGATTDGCVISGRLVRLTADVNTNTMVPGSEHVIINAWCQQFPSHSTDDIAFGADGALYVTAGEGASFNSVDYGQYGNTYAGDTRNPCADPPAGAGGVESPPTAEGGALRAQSMLRAAGEPVVLNGSLLRIDVSTGDGLSTNPNFSSTDLNARRIDAYGLRNPFRFTFRPGTNEVWIGDVGWGTWEEIDRVVDPTAASKNFGWPCYEGPNPQSAYQSAGLNICNNLSASAITMPYYAYQHGVAVVPGENCTPGGSSITGLSFYSGTAYPSAYQGALFFADYSRNCIWAMRTGSNGLPDPSKISLVVGNAGHPVDLEVGPGGDLFYADLIDGQIRRIQAVGPNAIAAATSPTTGATPLTVQFDGTQSTDPDPSATLSYAWDLNGDGIFNDSTLAKPSFTYTTPGLYNVRLKLTDSRGLSSVSSPLAIAAGLPPVPTINSPSSTLTWKVGDTISFSGSAVDGLGTPLPASALTWNVLLHHCVGGTATCHVHFIQSFSGVASGSFTAPDHEYPSYIELQLTATDPANGLQTTTSVRIDPKTVALTIQSTPAGAQIPIDGFTGTTPFTYSVIVGSTNSLSAPTSQTIAGNTYTFTSWSDGGSQVRTVLAGSTSATYTVQYKWTPTETTKLVLGDTSLLAPALWTAGKPPAAGAPLAVLSWVGTDSARRLNVETSTNGTTFANKLTLGDTSIATPSVLVINSKVVVLAWVGTDSAHHLNVMYDVYGSRKKLTLTETSLLPPSLTYFNGQVWLAWTGTNSTHSLNVLPLGPQGLAVGSKTILYSYSSATAPNLIADAAGSQLLLAWSQLAAPGKLTLAASSNGVNWSLPAGQPSAQTSAAPSSVVATTIGSSRAYYWVWAPTSGAHYLSLMNASAISAWSTPVSFGETAVGGPALGYPGPSGTLLLAWTGTDSAHHLNIATIRS